MQALLSFLVCRLTQPIMYCRVQSDYLITSTGICACWTT